MSSPASTMIADSPGPLRTMRLRAVWAAALLASLVFWLTAKPHVPWAFKFPRAWQLPLKRDISAFMKWLAEDASFGLFSFRDLTRGVSWLIDIPLDIATSILSSGFLKGQGSDAVQILPPLSWIAVIAIAVAMGRYARDWKLAALVGACFGYLAVFGQWN
ncbi:MAG: ABC transporter permease, partial [Aestuariivirgaceae bacterium]